jgi:hypothetical protein
MIFERSMPSDRILVFMSASMFSGMFTAGTAAGLAGVESCAITWIDTTSPSKQDATTKLRDIWKPLSGSDHSGAN